MRAGRDSIVLGLWGALCTVAAVHLAGYAPDDMFITFRYAWNLAHGEGLVFNPGERVFGLTNPGHGLGLALLHFVTRVPVHVLAVVVFAVALWSLAACLWFEMKRRGRALEAALGGTLALGSSYVWAAAGSASSAVMALLAGSALLIERRPVVAGLLAGFAVWYRPDAALGLAALGLLRWSETRRFPWRWAVAAGGVVLVGLVSAWLWFGSPIPGTLEAKRLMASAREAAWVGPERFWARGLPLYRRHFGPGWLFLLAAGVAGLWPLVSRGGRAVRTLVVYGVGVAIAYPLMKVPFFHWYTVPPMVVLLLGVGATVGSIGRAVVKQIEGPPGDASAASPGGSRRWTAAAVAGTLFLLLVLPMRSVVRHSLERFESLGADNRLASYREAALWIRENTPPENRIWYGEIGALAYWSRRPVDDPLGLVTPESLPFVAKGDWIGAFLRRPPDLFLDHPASPHPGIVGRPWFGAAYEPVARFPGEGIVGTSVVYRKRPGAELPPPRPPRDPRPR